MGVQFQICLPTVLEPSCHTVLNPLAINFERGVYNRLRLRMPQCEAGGNRLDKSIRQLQLDIKTKGLSPNRLPRLWNLRDDELSVRRMRERRRI
jgi:hypothetical protein